MKKTKSYKGIKKTIQIFMVLIILYSVAIFSNIDFVAKWRTIYIETAMSTMDHQWLATNFIPESVIEKVLLARSGQEEFQDGLETNWSIFPFSKKDLYEPWEKAEKNFYKIYSEIDEQSFEEYIEANEKEILNEDHFLVINKTDLQEEDTNIKTIQGDQVLAIDTENALSIIKITGDGYVGRLCIVKDPSRVGVGLSESYGEKGAIIADIAQYNQAVLAINASGFYDPDGHGNGGKAFGLVVSEGNILNDPLNGTNKKVGFDDQNKLNIGGEESSFSFRDAVEFKPALIINGEVLVTGSAGWGIQPRTAIGQTQNGEVLLLIIDGRMPGYSVGCTVGELAEIMERYGAVQACNLDGGSSSILYYNGQEISKPSAANKINGRNIPNGFVLYNRVD